MIVCIAEKPNVAKDIAKILGATTPHDGYMEGNGYQVTWTFGHLCTLKEPHDYSGLWKQWELAFLPMIPEKFGIKPIPNNNTYTKQLAVIERLMQQAERIVNCGDAGQEGELIQRWVMQVVKAKCPVDRLWISSLTEEAIREGFKALKPQSEYQSLYEAGLCRAIGDWLLGMNATRLYTLKYRQQRGQVLSIGRVQTPTLALIVNRQKEIQDFVPKQYWVLSTIYRDTVFTATHSKDADDGETTDTREEEIKAQFDAIKGKDFEITSITRKQGSEGAPRLFDLTSLQVECNRKYSFSAEETLRHIQSLYEKKLTTYPRVDTTYLSEDIYPKCPTILQGLIPYAALVQPLLATKLPKSKKIFDNSKVTDHHAIIPTGQNPQNATLSREEKQVYDLVARRFIGVFYPDCKFSTTTVLGKVETTEFKTTGKQILEEGWRVVFPKKQNTEENKKNEDEEKTLPDFKKGEKGPHEPTLTEKWTTPPKPYTEATLLRAMETAGKLVDEEELRDALKENGIGRPSTRAAIIETLFKRGYIQRKGKSLEATSTGVELIGIIHEDLLKSAELTGQWEKKLRDIEARKYDSHLFINELKQMVTVIVRQVLSDTSARRVPACAADGPQREKPGRYPGDTREKPQKKKKASSKAQKPVREGDICPLCGKGTIIRGKTALGCSEWRSGCTFRQNFEEK